MKQMNTTTIKKQYNNFHDVYTKNINEDAPSNAFFYRMIDFDIKGKRVLDIGCGDGTDLAILGANGAQVFGIDPSAEFIKKAQLKNPSGIFKEGVGESLPCDNAMFDIVISKWAIQTSTDVPAVLKETARALKKDGIFIYLTKHPLQQFMQKIRDNGHGVDYYNQQIVTSHIYGGKITLKEPSHTLGEYFNRDLFQDFELLDYQEGTDFPASEQFNNDTYPTFFVVKARRK